MKTKINNLIFFINLIYLNNINAGTWEKIHIAIYDNNISLVRNILENNLSEINSSTGGGLTPLHVAVKIRNLEIIKLLIKMV